MSLDRVPSRTEILNFIKLSQGSQFIIPVYQRNYTWDPKNETKKLLQDFYAMLTAKDKSSHFLGIIMYLPKQIDFAYSQFNIIDGQQRLTTIFLSLIAIRKIAQEKEDKIESIINQYYLYNEHLEEDKKFRMKPLVSDDDVFQKLLNDMHEHINEDDKQTLIYKNYKSLYEYFKNLSNDFSLSEIMDTLQKFNIVSIPLIETDDPQQIFESINSTGAPLTSADLIRNYILMNHDDKTQENLYNNHWKRIEGLQPDSKKLEEVIRHFIAIKLFDLPTKNDIYNDFKEWWNITSEDPSLKIDEICKYVNYYNLIYITEVSYLSPDLQEVIIEFRKTSSKMPASFLMEIYSIYDRKEISEKQLIKIIKIVNTYLIRRWITDLNTSPITRLFPTILRNVINECNGNFSEIVDITSYFLIDETINTKSYMPDDTQLNNYLQNNNAYSIKVIRIILEAIENQNNNAPVQFSKLNIEHIMPQRPNDYWRNLTNINDLEYIHNCNLLGNLTLCSAYDNSKMGNSEFSKKKEILEDTSHLKMNKDILAKDEWNIEDIIKRTKNMTNSIINLFPYYKSNYVPKHSSEVQISILSTNLKADAIYYSDDNIEIIRGSFFPSYNISNTKGSYLELLNELVDDGVISLEDGVYYFIKNYKFSSLSYSAGFLLNSRSLNGWDRWKLKNGEPISSIRNKI